ncbi:MAG: ArnT family glycosyltransferase [Planctomycetota bacterium]
MTFDDLRNRTDPLASPKAIWIIVGLVAVIQIAGISAKWWPSPDSALYLGLARSIAAGDGYLFNGQANTTVTPGLPGLLAGLRILFGESFYAANGLIALSGLVMLTMVWRISVDRVGRTIAPAVLLVVALSYPVYHAGHMVLTDVPFAACAWLCVWACLRLLKTARRRWLIVVAAACVAGVLIRAPGVLLLGALSLGVLVHRAGLLRWPARLAVAATIVLSSAAVLGAMLLLARSQAAGETPLYVAHSQQQLAGLGKVASNIAIGLGELPRSVSRLYSGQEFPPIGVALIALWLWGSWRAVRSGQTVLAITSLLYALALVLVGGEIGARSRYLLQVWPMMAMLIALGAVDVVSRVGRARGKRLTPRGLATVAVVTLGIGIAINAPRTLRNALYYGPLSHTDHYYKVIRDGDHRDLLATADLLKNHRREGTTILASGDDVSMLHFLTDRRIRSLPTGDAWVSRALSARDATLYAELAASIPGELLVVVDLSEGDRTFREAWRRHLEATPGLRELRTVGQYSIAHRSANASTP